MDKVKQRIAIAQACGWQIKPLAGYDIVVVNPEGFIRANGFAHRRLWKQLVEDFAHNLPDYLGDLNAIDKAVKSQRENAKFCPIDYTDTLLDVVRSESRLASERGCFAHTNATSPQRAEAFLRTLGLWEETA